MVSITLDQYLFCFISLLPYSMQQRKYISFLKIAIGRDYNSQKCCPNIFKFTKLNSFPFSYLGGGGGVSARILLYFVNIKSNSLKLTKWTLKCVR